jgi:hypothetical protein
MILDKEIGLYIAMYFRFILLRFSVKQLRH